MNLRELLRAGRAAITAAIRLMTLALYGLAALCNMWCELILEWRQVERRRKVVDDLKKTMMKVEQ